jgi:hypothetical protein
VRLSSALRIHAQSLCSTYVLHCCFKAIVMKHDCGTWVSQLRLVITSLPLLDLLFPAGRVGAQLLGERVRRYAKRRSNLVPLGVARDEGSALMWPSARGRVPGGVKRLGGHCLLLLRLIRIDDRQQGAACRGSGGCSSRGNPVGSCACHSQRWLRGWRCEGRGNSVRRYKHRRALLMCRWCSSPCGNGSRWIGSSQHGSVG